MVGSVSQNIGLSASEMRGGLYVMMKFQHQSPHIDQPVPGDLTVSVLSLFGRPYRQEKSTAKAKQLVTTL